MGKTSRRKSRHKSRKINKGMRKKILGMGTILVALVFAVILGIFIPKGNSGASGETIMSKEYTPGSEVARSLESNESLYKVSGHESVGNEPIGDESSDIGASSEDAKADHTTMDGLASKDIDLDVTSDTNLSMGDGDPLKSKEKALTTDPTDLADPRDTNTSISSTSESETSQSETPAKASADPADPRLDSGTTDPEAAGGATDPTPDGESTGTSMESSTSVAKEETQGPDSESSSLIDQGQTDLLDESDIPEGMTKEEEIQYVKDQWVDDMIQENRDSIEDTDLSAGASIYNQLDTNYLFGLAEGGLTEEENAEAMAYLEANLDEAQIELAKILFNKYIGLVE